jgi:hypothetical protein
VRLIINVISTFLLEFVAQPVLNTLAKEIPRIVVKVLHLKMIAQTLVANGQTGRVIRQDQTLHHLDMV